MWIKSSRNVSTIPAIRRLSSHDQSAVTRHFEHLDPTTRRMRFGGGTSHEFATRYASRVFQIDGVIYGAFADGRLLGVAELRDHFDICPSTAEAALSVEPEWQNRGIGNALLNRIIVAAKDRKINTLYMICLRENKKMQHLAAKHHAVMDFCSSQVEATIQPSRPKQQSVLNQEHIFVNAMLKTNKISQHEPLL